MEFLKKLTLIVQTTLKLQPKTSECFASVKAQAGSRKFGIWLGEAPEWPSEGTRLRGSDV